MLTLGLWKCQTVLHLFILTIQFRAVLARSWNGNREKPADGWTLFMSLENILSLKLFSQRSSLNYAKYFCHFFSSDSKPLNSKKCEELCGLWMNSSAAINARLNGETCSLTSLLTVNWVNTAERHSGKNASVERLCAKIFQLGDFFFSNCALNERRLILICVMFKRMLIITSNTTVVLACHWWKLKWLWIPIDSFEDRHGNSLTMALYSLLLWTLYNQRRRAFLTSGPHQDETGQVEEKIRLVISDKTTQSAVRDNRTNRETDSNVCNEDSHKDVIVSVLFSTFYFLPTNFKGSDKKKLLGTGRRWTINQFALEWCKKYIKKNNKQGTTPVSLRWKRSFCHRLKSISSLGDAPCNDHHNFV